MKLEWERMEAGWYIAHRGEVDVGAGVAKESDGRWHIYVGNHEEPGDSWRSAKTLTEAKRLAAGWLRRNGTGEGTP